MSHRTVRPYEGYLALNDVTLEDAGEYECIANNVVGPMSALTTLTVYQSPTITLNRNQSEIILTEGDELTIECLAEGLPVPIVQWKVEVGPCDREIKTYGVPQLATIQKYNVSRFDEGVYVCSASNILGSSDKKYVYVWVKEKPPTVRIIFTILLYCSICISIVVMVAFFIVKWVRFQSIINILF